MLDSPSCWMVIKLAYNPFSEKFLPKFSVIETNFGGPQAFSFLVINLVIDRVHTRTICCPCFKKWAVRNWCSLEYSYVEWVKGLSLLCEPQMHPTYVYN